MGEAKLKKKTLFCSLVAEKEGDETVLYVEYGGKRIASRRSGQNWTVLEPGYEVIGLEPGTEYEGLEVSYLPMSEH